MSTRLEQLEQRLAQLTEKLQEAKLDYLREVIDPLAPPGSRMLVFYTEYSGSAKPPQVEWLITASAGVQARYVLELHRPGGLSLLTTLLHTQELGEGPNRAEKELLLHLNAVTSSESRGERKIWMARTYLFPGKRQAPQPDAIKLRGKASTKKVTPKAPASIPPPKKEEAQTAPAPASKFQQALANHNAQKAGQPEEALAPEVANTPDQRSQQETATREKKEQTAGQLKGGDPPPPEGRNKLEFQEQEAAQTKAQVGDVWQRLSSIGGATYFLKVMEEEGDLYRCRSCEASGELKNSETLFTISTTDLNRKPSNYQLYQRTQIKTEPTPPAPIAPPNAEVQIVPAPAPPVQQTAPAQTDEQRAEARARVGDIWAALSSLSRKPAYFFKVVGQDDDIYACQRCNATGESKEGTTPFEMKASKLDGTHRLFKLHQRE